MTLPTREQLIGLAKQILVLAACGLAGWGAAMLHIPLPWLVGPLLTMAAFSLAGLDIRPLPASRQVGQLLVGAAIGLYFSPEAAKQVGLYLPLMIVASIGTIVAGGVAGLVLVRFGHTTPTTAFFASVPGGVAEMSVLGERFGADTGAVALAQSLRIACVVLTLPPALTAIGSAGTDAYTPVALPFSLSGYALMMACATALALTLWKLRVTNPWVLGALATGMVVATGEFNLSSVPGPVVNFGQVLIGCALGSRFKRSFLLKAPRFLVVAIASNLVLVAVSVAFAALLDQFVRIPFATMVLALAPGGVAEMSLTARTLALGVPMVTAFHVIRIFTIIVGTGYLFQLVRAIKRRAVAS